MGSTKLDAVGSQGVVRTQSGHIGSTSIRLVPAVPSHREKASEMHEDQLIMELQQSAAAV